MRLEDKISFKRLQFFVNLFSCWLGLMLCLVIPTLSEAIVEGISRTPEPTDMNITYGGLNNCSIDVDGDSDVFRFSGGIGETVEIWATVPGGIPCIELIAPNGTNIVEYPILKLAGTHSTLIRGKASTPQYTLSLQCPCSPFENDPTSEGASKAYEHLYEVMDKYHKNFDVYTDISAAGNHFVMLGRMASKGSEDKVEINPGFKSNCYSGATCIENKFFSSGDNWGGWYFMNGVLEGEETQPKANWGDYPDAGFDLTGATKITFYAKGESGGEKVEFFAFGVGRDAETGVPIKPYPDSSPKVTLGYRTLTSSWKPYKLDLTGVDLSYVLGGFGWVANAKRNNNDDITFYLDEIKYDKSRLGEPRFLVSYVSPLTLF
jgi:hypothetical protein